jgi:hypothetical protein
MAAKKASAMPPEKLALHERLVAAVPEAELKVNFASGYTAVNGNMYSMISKHGLVGIRLPAAERTAFQERHEADLFRGDPDWPPAKEYVAVPEDLLPDIDTLRPCLESALRYASGLKPKATKRS